ncbi:MAG: carboxypeptidase-like regulatory domain-containing protein [Acidobacteriota bacterium]|nr:carboxypeptidase-like regulatory domain-containing protein [Acidobacteriota bacterium]
MHYSVRYGAAAVCAVLVVFLFAPCAQAHVTTFGPRSYALPSGPPASVTETFDANGACDANALAVYTIVVTNGLANGERRVSSGTISLNGTEVVSESQFSQQAATIEKTVALKRTGNQLSVTLQGGKKDATISLSIIRHIDVTTNVLAETKFIATGTKAETLRKSFAADNLGDRFSIVVTNGAIKKGSIALNGATVVSQQEFPSGQLQKNVTLKAANELVVSVTPTKAGDFVNVAVLRHPIDTTGPTIRIDGLTDGQTVAASPLVVNGAVTDVSGIASASLNNQPLTLGANGAFQAAVPLVAGTNILTIAGSDCEGNASQQQIRVVLASDTAPPTVRIDVPAAGTITNQTQIAVSGVATDDTGVASVTVNGMPMTLTGGTWSGSVSFPAANATRTLTATATDRGGRTAVASVDIDIDVTAPVVTGITPTDGTTLSESSVTIRGTVSDAPAGVASVTCNGTAATVGAGAFACNVTLQAGVNEIAIVATDTVTNAATTTLHYTLETDTAPPTITISLPLEGAWIRTAQLTVTGTASDDSGLASVIVNGLPATLDGGNWTISLALGGDGPKTITVVATDTSNATASATVNVTLDTTAPSLTIEVPGETATLYDQTKVTVAGRVSDALSGLASVTCNGTAATITDDVYVCEVPLTSGANSVDVRATDHAGNETARAGAISVLSDTTQPAITASIVPPPNADDWIAWVAEVTFVCGDAESGLAECSGSDVVQEGAVQLISGTAVDRSGNRRDAAVVVNVDKTPPTLAIDGVDPDAPFLVVPGPSITIEGSATDALSGVKSVTCNDAAATLTGERFRCVIALSGMTTVAVRVMDRAGLQALGAITFLVDDSAPSITIKTPTDGAIVEDGNIAVSGYASDDQSDVTLTVNGIAVPVVDAVFNTTIAAAAGDTTITVEATDAVGNITTQSVSVTRFIVPHVTITEPADLAVVADSVIVVRGTVGEGVTGVVVNGITATISGHTFVAADVPLQQGRSVITAIGRTDAGRMASASIFIYRDSIPPRVTPTFPPPDVQIYDDVVTVSGNVDDIVVGTVNSEQVTVTVGGVAAEVANRSFTRRNIPLEPENNDLTIVATDQAGNVTTVEYDLWHTPMPAIAHLVIVSGNDQSAPIGTTLPTPLRVRLVEGSGTPVANALLEFHVTGDNGSLRSGASEGRVLKLTTNAQGEASAVWTLGMRAGVSFNRVEVRSDRSVNFAAFQAQTVQGQPNLIVVDSGQSQFGATGQRLPRPLVAVVVDAGSNRLAGVPVIFAVERGGGSIDGQSSVTVVSDSDGRAWVNPTLGDEAGNDSNVFVAMTPQGARAEFVASGRTIGDPAATRITGVVQDNMNVPIAGVSVRIDGTTIAAETDAEGQFVLPGVPVGYVKLFVDGTTTQRDGTWPTLEYPIYTIAGIDNRIEMPIFLLPIDVRRGLHVDDSTGGTLTIPELPGFSLTIPAGTATFPGGGRTGVVSATLVHFDKMPMTPAFGQQPRFIVTIQPTGVHFDPPAVVTFPNTDGLVPGEITELYSFDHDLGQFVSIGTGSVTDDGSIVRSDPGAGIVKGGWHGGGNPAPQGNAQALSVTIQPERTVVGIGEVVNVTATGTPQGGSYVNWTVDNPSIGNFLNQPSCSGLATCTARLRLDQEGSVHVKVSYTRNGAITTSGTKKVTASRFRIQELQYTQVEHRLRRDELGSDLTAYPAIQWTLGGTSAPVWYEASTANTAKKMKVRVKLKVSPPLTDPRQMVVESGAPYHFSRTVLILPNEDDLWLQGEFESSESLPAATAAFRPLTLSWKGTFVGQTDSFDLGTTSNDVYVSFPSGGNDPVPLTVLRLAIGFGGAGTKESALMQTWNAFSSGSGPAGVKNHEDMDLVYYEINRHPLSQCALSASNDLLKIGNGQCRTFVDLLAQALDVNGIASQRIEVKAVPSSPLSSLLLGASPRLLVKNWGFVGMPGLLSGEYDAEFPNGETSETFWDYPPSTSYGQLVRETGIPGQNSPTPAVKVFGNHVILLPLISDGGPPYYDPSYGVRYQDADDFVVKALDGFGVSWNSYSKTMKVRRASSVFTGGSVVFVPIGL